MSPPVGATEIAADVWCIGPHGHTQTNVYLVRAGSTSALVDAGWAGDATRIADAVRAIVGPHAVPTAILLTHVHPDHAGAARRLADEWDCPVLVHPSEIPFAKGDFEAMTRSAGPLDRWLILPAMRIMGRRRREALLASSSLAEIIRPLGPDDAVPGIDGWSWMATPGHTPGHISFVRKTDGVTLTGDALVTLRVNSALGIIAGRPGLSGPPWYTTWDPRRAAASIAAIAALEPRVVAGGHGQPLTGPGTAAAVGALAASVAATEPHHVVRILGRAALVLSGLGFPLTQAVISRWGQRGAVVSEAVATGLLVRDLALVRGGTPTRLQRLPATLLWLELGIAAAASALGLVAIARPDRPMGPTPAGRLEALRRFAMGLLFGVHTMRFRIYLGPDRGRVG